MRAILVGLACLLAARAAFGQDAAYRDELIGRSRELELSGLRKWHRLLHYQARGKGWRSEADGAKFFISPQGRTDPAAELEATIASFFGPPPADAKSQHPQCRFPARYAWLKDKLAFAPERLPEHPCPDFEAWRNAIGAQAVSLVFADAFLGNPSSMYGHTFLRMHRQAAGEGDALLDYTINFEGIPNTDNVILYTLRGVYGGFRGEFSLMPFYMKTQEYSNLECRDLWDYRLNFSAAQIDLLLRHAWEMGSTYFDYYFFTKNCSYQLLTLLESADDSLDLSARFPLAVIPADTVRVLLSQPGLAGETHYRPSFVTEMKARRARLSEGELAAAARLGRKVDDAELGALQSFPPGRQALVLDSAHDYLLYNSGFYTKPSTETSTAEHALLVARGRLGEPPAPFTIPPPRPLEAGHDTARAGLGFGTNRRFSFEELSWRGSLHDLPASDDGYIPDSQLEMLNARLRFDNNGRQPYIERLDLFDIVALTPWDPWLRKLSWRISTGVDQAKELGCNGASCMYYGLGGGAGLSALTHLGRRELFYALAEADLGAAPVFDQGWRSGAGGTAGLMLDLTRSWRTLFEATYIGYAGSPAQQRLRLASSWHLSRDAELRLSLDRRVPDEEAGLSFFLYF
ncbi:MAG: DUF4105 domain-containing protein [Elusimicrobia bacterium]|nr:DUF4105 domain-containing protein [Elusimicrobiota bacterium]